MVQGARTRGTPAGVWGREAEGTGQEGACAGQQSPWAPRNSGLLSTLGRGPEHSQEVALFAKDGASVIAGITPTGLNRLILLLTLLWAKHSPRAWKTITKGRGFLHLGKC